MRNEEFPPNPHLEFRILNFEFPPTLPAIESPSRKSGQQVNLTDVGGP